MRSGMLAVVMLVLLAAELVVAAPAGRIRVHVAIAPSQSEFVDSRATERQHAAGDLRENIVKKQKQWLELVESPEQADVRVEIVDRVLVKTGRMESTTTATASTNKKGDWGYGTANTSTREIEEYTVRAVLKVGEHVEELTGAVPDTYFLGGPWRAAAGQVGEAVEKFARNNYERLLARRGKP